MAIAAARAFVPDRLVALMTSSSFSSGHWSLLLYHKRLRYRAPVCTDERHKDTRTGRVGSENARRVMKRGTEICDVDVSGLATQAPGGPLYLADTWEAHESEGLMHCSHIEEEDGLGRVVRSGEKEGLSRMGG